MKLKVTWPSGAGTTPAPRHSQPVSAGTAWYLLTLPHVSPDKACPCQNRERPPGVLHSKVVLQSPSYTCQTGAAHGTSERTLNATSC